MKKAQLTTKIDQIKYMQQTEGWKYFEEFLTKREVLLLNSMRKGTLEKLNEVRGSLRELDRIKKYLQIEQLEAQQVINELQNFELGGGILS